MTDKERILQSVIRIILPKASLRSYNSSDEPVKLVLDPSKLEKGDLIFAATTFVENDFSVGFFECFKDGCVVIREIGSQRLGNYYNEVFYKIDKSL